MNHLHYTWHIMFKFCMQKKAWANISLATKALCPQLTNCLKACGFSFNSPDLSPKSWSPAGKYMALSLSKANTGKYMALSLSKANTGKCIALYISNPNSLIFSLFSGLGWSDKTYETCQTKKFGSTWKSWTPIASLAAKLQALRQFRFLRQIQSLQAVWARKIYQVEVSGILLAPNRQMCCFAQNLRKNRNRWCTLHSPIFLTIKMWCFFINVTWTF